MARDLALVECRAQAYPAMGDPRALHEVIEDFSVSAGGMRLRKRGAVDRLGLAPIPMHCDLPHLGRGRPNRVWGYAHASLGVVNHRVGVSTVRVAVDGAGQRPVLEQALKAPGVVFTQRRAEHLAQTADSLFQSFSPPQANALDVRLACEALALTWSRVEDTQGSETPLVRDDASIGDSIQRGRLVVTPASGGTGDALALASLHLEVPVDNALVPLGVDFGVVEGELPGAGEFTDSRAEPYLLMRARMGDSPTDAQFEVTVTLLQHVLEHVVAHSWLLERARRINEQQNALVNRLLAPDTSVRQLHTLQSRLFRLQVAFINQVEFGWSFASDAPAGSEETIDEIERELAVGHRWEKEVRRFQGLNAIAQQASVPAPPVGESPKTAQDRIAGFSDHRNPFLQLKLRFSDVRHVRRERRTEREDRAAEAKAVGATGTRVGAQSRGGLDAVPPGTKEIAVHPFRNRFALFEELHSSVALTTFMTATSIVFLGLVLNPTVNTADTTGTNVDVLFLFIASFGFFFGTLLYANASGKLARHGTVGFERQVEIGNSVSEYFGVYALLVAVPLVVARYIDGWVSVTVAALAIISMLCYHAIPGSSLLERDVGDDAMGSDVLRRIIYFLLTVSMAGTFLGEIRGYPTVEVCGGVVFGLGCLFCFFLSIALPERASPDQYLVDDWDCLGEETPSLFNRRARGSDLVESRGLDGS